MLFARCSYVIFSVYPPSVPAQCLCNSACIMLNAVSVYCVCVCVCVQCVIVRLVVGIRRQLETIGAGWCSRCREVYYCSQMCRDAHFVHHRVVCSFSLRVQRFRTGLIECMNLHPFLDPAAWVQGGVRRVNWDGSPVRVIFPATDRCVYCVRIRHSRDLARILQSLSLNGNEGVRPEDGWVRFSLEDIRFWCEEIICDLVGDNAAYCSLLNNLKAYDPIHHSCFMVTCRDRFRQFTMVQSFIVPRCPG